MSRETLVNPLHPPCVIIFGDTVAKPLECNELFEWPITIMIPLSIAYFSKWK